MLVYSQNFVRLRGRCCLIDKLSVMPSRSVVTLTQKWAVFSAFLSREVTLGQMWKIRILLIIYRS